MFKPSYNISNKLLSNIKNITAVITELNYKRYQQAILEQIEKNSRELSIYATAGIERSRLSRKEIKEIIEKDYEKLEKSEKEVLNHYNCIKELNKNKNQTISLELILKINRKLVDGPKKEGGPGRLREESVFVNSSKKENKGYWPPDHKDIAKLMNHLLYFVIKNSNMIDPLIIAGIFYKKFISIHPFMECNDRTALLATRIILADIGLNNIELCSFENYYNNNIAGYIKNINVPGNYYDTDDLIDYSRWLEYFTDGILDELLRIKGLLSEISIDPGTELFAHHRSIIGFIEKKGYIMDRDYAKLMDRAKATRSLDFKKLINMGLIERKGKGRATYYKLKER